MHVIVILYKRSALNSGAVRQTWLAVSLGRIPSPHTWTLTCSLVCRC